MASVLFRNRFPCFVTFAAVVLGLFAAIACCSYAQSAQTSPAEDKYIWLEDVSSAKSLNWVKSENARTAAVLENDPHYKAFFADALKIGEDPSRLAYPDERGDMVYNTWRDKNNPRGLLRKTTMDSYLSSDPQWKTVIDFDALGKRENVGWVSHGESCLYPGDRLCLITLSAGGEDANTQREFDLKGGRFVDGGFTLPHSKGSSAWVDENTLLTTRDWGGGTSTNSGYPFVVKEWKRGAPLTEAKEVFRGDATDQVGTYAEVLHDAQGDQLVLFQRGVTFFESQKFVQTPTGVKRFAIPNKAGVAGILKGRVLIFTHEDWDANGERFAKGSLLELKLSDVMADPAHLKPAIVFAPDGKEFIQTVQSTKSTLLLITLSNVNGRAYLYSPSGRGWTRGRVALPDNVSVYVADASSTDERYFLTVQGFLQPASLWMGDAAKGTEIRKIRSEPEQFNAANLITEQFFATSKDGTRVPYFIVHRKDIKYDGSNATLLEAYGGFEVSETPRYSAVLGKLWLEHGGVYVLANIRGGGEFGPAWHEAGLKTHRQRIYDDFAAVGQDLITRKVTSSRHLGIEGGSNGGLLMGVEMTQHPDLWNAVIIAVPLLDMLRFEKIAAGASWVGEYGSVTNPDERAFLAGISPYNQLKPGVKYPEPFIFTTTKDDRVGPQHARKFAAKMEEFHEPFFYDEIIEGGHGAGANIQQEARTRAIEYVYLTRKLME